MIDVKPIPALVSLEDYVGAYRSDALEISLRSLGYGCGLEVVWKWASGSIDVGLIGTRDGIGLSINMICNSQPWYGQAFLRSLDVDTIQEGSSAGSMTFREVLAEEASTEILSLTFHEDSLRFVFERQAQSKFRKEWVLRRT